MEQEQDVPALAVVGVGETELSRDSGRSVTRLAVEAAQLALADAGLRPSDIDGIMPYQIGATTEDLMAGLGLSKLSFSAVTHLGGASSVASLRTAALALRAGAATHILLFNARNGHSEARVAVRAGQQVPGSAFRNGLEVPQGLSSPAQWYSLLARRHMYEFGTTREQLGSVAITMREHAQLNPAAQMYGRPLTMEQYLSGRPIADPYWLYDCCLESDGACALIVTTPERARDLAQPVVAMLSAAEGHGDSPDDIVNRRDFFSIGLTKAAPVAFGAAGLAPGDVDVALIYDCFTFEVIQQLEEAGFCPRGTGGPFVEQGHIRLGGTLPVNPHGGMLSAGHLAGIGHIAEAVHQLRGSAGDRQVSGAEIAAVTGWGDLGDGALMLLARM
jgi:acetyl-CoA acetyltransferase